MGHLDDEVKRLQGVIANIEGRVQALEGRQLGGSQKKTAEEIRMLLIGPPGAGTWSSSCLERRARQTRG
jgi:adenylate kinase